MKQTSTILFHSDNSTLYQLISCYLNLVGFRIIATPKSKDLLQKVDRQKFQAILIDSKSESFLNQFLYTTNLKDNMNNNTPVLLIVDPRLELSIEEKLSARVKAILTMPFELAKIHLTLTSFVDSPSK